MGLSVSDADIIARVLDGDTEAFGILVDRYQAECAAFATHMTGSADDAADVVQESLVRAFKSLRRCRDRDRFKGWLFRILSNQCKTHLTRQRTRRAEGLAAAADVATEQTPEAAVEADELRQRVHEALLELPPDRREALVLKYVNGLSLPELSEVLGSSVPALKMRLLRARAGLRERLTRVMP
jgi:RNA polymerase sigma-70 factor (ECF subfamily)